MSNIKLYDVDKETFVPGFKIFTKSMGFDQATEAQMIAYIKTFYNHNSFIGIYQEKLH